MVSEHNLMTDDLLRQVIGVGRVDLLVGAPQVVRPEDAASLVRAVRACFRTHFPRQRAALLYIDGAADAVTSTVARCWHEETLGRDALRTMQLMTAAMSSPDADALSPRLVLAAADLLQARAVVFVDTDNVELTPEAIAKLAGPLHNDSADLVAPLHPLAADAGLLVTQLLRPLTRGIYGRDVREPLLPAFGASARFTSHCAQLDFSVNRPQWQTRYWIAAEALAGSFVVNEQALGPRRTPAARVQGGFAGVFLQVVHSVFASIDAHADAWGRRASTAMSSPPPESGAVSTGAARDGARLLEAFPQDLNNLDEILQRILHGDTLAALRAAAAATSPGPRLPGALWAEVVEEFLLAFHHNLILREHTIQALLPLYMARIGTFLIEHAEAGADDVDAAVESLCLEFERVKPRTVERWLEPAKR